MIPIHALLRLISLLVPAAKRAEWLSEWSAELEHARLGASRRGEPLGHTRSRLTIRTLEALPDALWLRWRHAGRVGSRTIRDATRGLVRRPGHTVTVVATLALGMGSATAIFTVVDSLVLRPIPFHEPERLVSILGARGAPYVDLEALREWRSQDRVFSDVRAFGVGTYVLTGAGEAREYGARLVEPGFLDLLGIRPALGRGFTEDDALLESRVVMVSDAVWSESFGRDRDIIGRTVDLNADPHTVVGVLPPTLRQVPDGIVHLLLPLSDPPPWDAVSALGRLQPDLSLAGAQARLNDVSATLSVARPREAGWEVGLRQMERRQRPAEGAGFITLGVAVLCLLLVACANAAGLLLLRGVTRQPELRLRLALGASRWSLLTHVLVESALLAIAAGATGTALAWWGVRGLVALLPPNMISFSYTTVSIDGRVLAFTLLVTLLTGVVFGSLPAWRAARVAALGAGRASTATREEVKLRAAMQVGQMALAVLLVAGAGLFGQSFKRIMAVPLGYDVDHRLELRLVSPDRVQGGVDGAAMFARGLDDGLRALPGILGVSRATGVGFLSGYSIELGNGERRDSVPEPLPHLSVDTAYFRVMDIRFMEGRAFRAEDLVAESDAVIIDRDLAAMLWPGQSAVGRKFRVRSDPWVTVVGVTDDVKLEGPRDPFGPYLLFYPATREALRSAGVQLLTAGDPAEMEKSVRGVVQQLDPNQPIRSLETGRQALGEAVADPRFLVVVMTVLAAVSVMLAAVGVYGLVSFTVAQRKREIGIRLALGARTASVVGEVVRWGLMLGTMGVVIGLVFSALLARFVSALLFDAPPWDPNVLGIAALTLLASCCAALARPAIRAAAVDPAEALRSE